jgi:ATP-binding cassette, subfamily C, bacterial CydD
MVGTVAWLRERAKPARRQLALTVAQGELSGILHLLQTGFLVRVGDDVIFRGSSLADLAPILAAFLGVAAARALLTWSMRRTAFACASRVKQSLRGACVERLRLIGPAGLAGMKAGEIASTTVDAVEALEPYLSRYLPQRAVASLLPLTVLAVVFPLDWISGLVLVLTAVFLPVSMILIGEEAHERNRRLWGTLTRLSGRFLDALQGLPTTRMFGAARREAEAIARASEEYRASTMSVLRIAFVSSLMLELVSTLSIAIVAVICGVRLLHGGMGFAPGYFIILVAPEYFHTLRLLGTYYHSRMEAAAAAEQIRELLETSAPLPARQGAALPAPLPPPVAFRFVSFAYPGRPVLSGACFEVRAGESVAIAGPSGAGKSTILALLLGFLRPDDGTIAVAGRDLAELDGRAWLDRVAWLPQRPTLFHGTLADNIRLGRREATDEEVDRAARLAYVDEFSSRLPEGLGTLIGERGEGLSGGQAQRVALARLFLRDPLLVLLDEPTAHLDAVSEELVTLGIRALSGGRTTLFVTHRSAQAGALDRILVVRDGAVEEAR